MIDRRGLTWAAPIAFARRFRFTICIARRVQTILNAAKSFAGLKQASESPLAICNPRVRAAN
jgi:hypothetical protein